MRMDDISNQRDTFDVDVWDDKIEHKRRTTIEILSFLDVNAKSYPSIQSVSSPRLVALEMFKDHRWENWLSMTFSLFQLELLI